MKCVAVLLLIVLCFGAGLAAEGAATTTKLPGEPGNSLTALCTKPNKPLTMCDEYILAHFGDKADILLDLVIGVDNQKDTAKVSASTSYANAQVTQWTLVILAFLTTVVSALAKSYPNWAIPRTGVQLPIIPIVLASLVTLVTSMGSYYNFGDWRQKHLAAGQDLAELQSDINFALLDAVARGGARGGAEILTLENVNAWRGRANTILQRYREKETGS